MINSYLHTSYCTTLLYAKIIEYRVKDMTLNTKNHERLTCYSTPTPPPILGRYGKENLTILKYFVLTLNAKTLRALDDELDSVIDDLSTPVTPQIMQMSLAYCSIKAVSQLVCQLRQQLPPHAHF